MGSCRAELMFVGSRRDEQLTLRSHQDIVFTVEDSVLRTEMTTQVHGVFSKKNPGSWVFFDPNLCPVKDFNFLKF